MTTIEYVEKAWIAYKKNFWQIVTALFLQILLFSLPVIMGLMPWIFILPFSKNVSLTTTLMSNLGVLSFSIVMVIVGILVSTILNGGLVRMLYESLNRRTRFEVMFKTAQAKFWTILGANLIVLLILFVILTVIFSPLMIFVSISNLSIQSLPPFFMLMLFLSIGLGLVVLVVVSMLFMFVNQAIVIDNLSAFGAVKKSFEFSKKNFINILFLLFIFLFFNAGLNNVLYLVAPILTFFATSPLLLLSLTAFYSERRKKTK